MSLSGAGTTPVGGTVSLNAPASCYKYSATFSNGVQGCCTALDPQVVVYCTGGDTNCVNPPAKKHKKHK